MEAEKVTQEIREGIIQTIIKPRIRFGETGISPERRYAITTEFVFEVADGIIEYLKNRGDIKILDENGESRNSWFLRNCKQQRNKPAKICPECPFVDFQTGFTKCVSKDSLKDFTV